MKGQKKGVSAFLLTFLLWPFSLIYGAGVFCHHLYYRLSGGYKASTPVISIGNITVGGSGKTPLAILVSRYLREKGVNAAILIRGYMPGASQESDEVEMLREQIPEIPVLAGSDRVRNIKQALQGPQDVFIADDAFQHWPLCRDLDIVTIDAGNPFGNGYLLPAGTLREPVSALRRADIFVVTKAVHACDIPGLTSRLKEINPKALTVESRYINSAPIDVFGLEKIAGDYLNGKQVLGFSAIGDPLSFESSLRISGAKVSRFFSFMDHHVYSTKDIQLMVEYGRDKNISVLVTTHKDAVKLRAFKGLLAGFRLLYLPVQLEITKGSDEFYQKIISVCRH